MTRGAHTARKTPGALRLALASLFLCAGVASARGPAAGARVAAADGLELQMDLGRMVANLGPARTRSRDRAAPAAALPDPRALKGAHARTAARLRLNVKGFSLLEAREREDPTIRVRRIRDREWRRPVLSLTLQKRF